MDLDAVRDFYQCAVKKRKVVLEKLLALYGILFQYLLFPFFATFFRFLERLWLFFKI
jgi:hypothetical protein